tara:strand:- start:153 stop:428 length:276 start_codon:yes stop_codon:yes gene_type:complete
MSGFERKVKRNKMKQSKKDIQEKMTLFGKIGEECESCQKPFDKKDAEQVKSWNVVVREDEGSVRIYCPVCWTKALEVIEGFKKHMEEKNAN